LVEALCPRTGNFFAREFCARDEKENLLLAKFTLMETKTLLLPVRLFVSCARRRETKNFISSSRSYARQILQLLSLGSVLCEQRDVTFEVTDASFCAATCQAYEEV
jgi:hypothetical protein